jgi:hypothetical protein
MGLETKEDEMSKPIVFISHFKVKEGKTEGLQQLNEKVTAQLKTDKPGTVGFLLFMNQAATELSIVHIFPDAESFDRHIEGAGERSNVSLEFIEPTGRELYGMPSDQAMEILEPPKEYEMTFLRVPKFSNGFLRLMKG